jgi:hypothetical protein
VDGPRKFERSRGPFPDLQTAMLESVALVTELKAEFGGPFDHPGPAVIAFKRKMVITNLATQRRVQPSRAQWRWAYQPALMDRASWIWPRAQETEM